MLLSLLAFVALYAAAVALSLPGGAVLTLAGGFLFGWLLGGVASILAATIGASVVFLIARSALGEFLAARAGPWLSRFRQGFQEDAFSYLLFLRLVPIFPFWLVNLAPDCSAWTSPPMSPPPSSVSSRERLPIRWPAVGSTASSRRSKLRTNPALPRWGREAKSLARIRSIQGRF